MRSIVVIITLEPALASLGGQAFGARLLILKDFVYGTYGDFEALGYNPLSQAVECEFDHGP